MSRKKVQMSDNFKTVKKVLIKVKLQLQNESMHGFKIRSV